MKRLMKYLIGLAGMALLGAGVMSLRNTAYATDVTLDTSSYTAFTSAEDYSSTVTHYTISSADAFTAFLGLTSTKANDVFVLTQNIDMTGKSARQNNEFKGVLNGQGYTISNYSYTGTDSDTDYSMFTTVSGTIRNLTFSTVSLTVGTKEDASYDEYGNAGVISTLESTGVLEDVTVTGLTINSSDNELVSYAGAVAQNNGRISNVKVSSSSVYAGYMAGGITGKNTGTIEACTVSQSLVYGHVYVGGITGHNGSNAYVSSCAVEDSSHVFQGLIYTSWETFTNPTYLSGKSYYIADFINGAGATAPSCGGVAGYNAGGSIIHCYFLGQTSDTTDFGVEARTGSSLRVAGICGYTEAEDSVKDCVFQGLLRSNPESEDGELTNTSNSISSFITIMSDANKVSTIEASNYYYSGSKYYEGDTDGSLTCQGKTFDLANDTVDTGTFTSWQTTLATDYATADMKEYGVYTATYSSSVISFTRTPVNTAFTFSISTEDLPDDITLETVSETTKLFAISQTDSEEDIIEYIDLASVTTSETAISGTTSACKYFSPNYRLFYYDLIRKSWELMDYGNSDINKISTSLYRESEDSLYNTDFCWITFDISNTYDDNSDWISGSDMELVNQYRCKTNAGYSGTGYLPGCLSVAEGYSGNKIKYTATFMRDGSSHDISSNALYTDCYFSNNLAFTLKIEKATLKVTYVIGNGVELVSPYTQGDYTLTKEDSDFNYSLSFEGGSDTWPEPFTVDGFFLGSDGNYYKVTSIAIKDMYDQTVESTPTEVDENYTVTITGTQLVKKTITFKATVSSVHEGKTASDFPFTVKYFDMDAFVYVELTTDLDPNFSIDQSDTDAITVTFSERSQLYLTYIYGYDEECFLISGATFGSSATVTFLEVYTPEVTYNGTVLREAKSVYTYAFSDITDESGEAMTNGDVTIYVGVDEDYDYITLAVSDDFKTENPSFLNNEADSYIYSNPISQSYTLTLSVVLETHTVKYSYYADGSHYYETINKTNADATIEYGQAYTSHKVNDIISLYSKDGTLATYMITRIGAYTDEDQENDYGDSVVKKSDLYVKYVVAEVKTYTLTGLILDGEEKTLTEDMFSIGNIYLYNGTAEGDYTMKWDSENSQMIFYHPYSCYGDYPYAYVTLDSGASWIRFLQLTGDDDTGAQSLYTRKISGDSNVTPEVTEIICANSLTYEVKLTTTSGYKAVVSDSLTGVYLDDKYTVMTILQDESSDAIAITSKYLYYVTYAIQDTSGNSIHLKNEGDDDFTEEQKYAYAEGETVIEAYYEKQVISSSSNDQSKNYIIRSITGYPEELIMPGENVTVTVVLAEALLVKEVNPTWDNVKQSGTYHFNSSRYGGTATDIAYVTGAYIERVSYIVIDKEALGDDTVYLFYTWTDKDNYEVFICDFTKNTTKLTDDILYIRQLTLSSEGLQQAASSSEYFYSNSTEWITDGGYIDVTFDCTEGQVAKASVNYENGYTLPSKFKSSTIHVSNIKMSLEFTFTVETGEWTYTRIYEFTDTEGTKYTETQETEITYGTSIEDSLPAIAEEDTFTPSASDVSDGSISYYASMHSDAEFWIYSISTVSDTTMPAGDITQTITVALKQYVIYSFVISNGEKSETSTVTDDWKVLVKAGDAVSLMEGIAEGKYVVFENDTIFKTADFYDLTCMYITEIADYDATVPENGDVTITVSVIPATRCEFTISYADTYTMSDFTFLASEKEEYAEGYTGSNLYVNDGVIYYTSSFYGYLQVTVADDATYKVYLGHIEDQTIYPISIYKLTVVDADSTDGYTFSGTGFYAKGLGVPIKTNETLPANKMIMLQALDASCATNEAEYTATFYMEGDSTDDVSVDAILETITHTKTVHWTLTAADGTTSDKDVEETIEYGNSCALSNATGIEIDGVKYLITSEEYAVEGQDTIIKYSDVEIYAEAEERGDVTVSVTINGVEQSLEKKNLVLSESYTTATPKDGATVAVISGSTVGYSASAVYGDSVAYLWYVDENSHAFLLADVTEETVTKILFTVSISLPDGLTMENSYYYESGTTATISYAGISEGREVSLLSEDSTVTVDPDKMVVTIENISKAYSLEFEVKNRTYTITYVFMDAAGNTLTSDEDGTEATQDVEFSTAVSYENTVGMYKSLYDTVNKQMKSYFISQMKYDTSDVPETMPAMNFTVTVTCTDALESTFSVYVDDTALTKDQYTLILSDKDAEAATPDDSVYSYHASDTLYVSKACKLWITYDGETLELGTDSGEDSIEKKIYSVTVTLDQSLVTFSETSKDKYYLAGESPEISFTVPAGYVITCTSEDVTVDSDTTLTVTSIAKKEEITVGLDYKTFHIYYYKDKDAYDTYYESEKDSMDSSSNLYGSVTSVKYMSEISYQDLGTIDGETKLTAWLDPETDKKATYTTMPAKDLVLYGNWAVRAAVEITVILYDGGINAASEDSIRLSSTKGTFTEITAENDDVYAFSYDSSSSLYSMYCGDVKNTYVFVKYPGTENYVYLCDAEGASSVTMYHVTAKAGEHYTVEGLGWHASGELVLTFTPDEGYEMKCLNSGYEMYNNTLTIHEVNEKLPEFEFEATLKDYYIYYYMNGKKWKTDTYKFGDTIEWPTPNTGDYIFRGWVDGNGDLIDYVTMPSTDFAATADLSLIKTNTITVVYPEDSLLTGAMFFVSESKDEVLNKTSGKTDGASVSFEYSGAGYLWISDPVSGEERSLGVTVSGNPELTFVGVTLADTSVTEHLYISNLGYILQGDTVSIEVTPETGYGFTATGYEIRNNTITLSNVEKSLELDIQEMSKEYSVNYYVEGELVHTDTYHYLDKVTMWTYTGTVKFASWSTEITEMPDYSINVYAQNIVSYTLVTYPSATKIHEGQTLGDSIISGGLIYIGGEIAEGTYAFKNPDYKPSKSDSLVTSFTVVFTESSETYVPYEFQLTLEICNPEYPSESLEEPVLLGATASSVTFRMNESYEYTLDGENYFEGGEITIKGLREKESVTVSYRYREDSAYCASELKTVTFKSLSKEEISYDKAAKEGMDVLESFDGTIENQAAREFMASMKDKFNTDFEDAEMTSEEVEALAEYVGEVLELMVSVEEIRGTLVHMDTDRIRGYADHRIDEFATLATGSVAIEKIESYENFVVRVFDVADTLLGMYNVLEKDLMKSTSLNALEDTGAMTESEFVVDKVDELLEYNYDSYSHVDLDEYKDDYVGKAVSLMSDADGSVHACDGKEISQTIGKQVATLQYLTYEDYKFDREAYDEAFWLAAEAAIIAHIQGLTLVFADTQLALMYATTTDAKARAVYKELYDALVAEYGDYDTFRELYFEAIGDSGDVLYEDVIVIFQDNVVKALTLPVSNSLSEVEIFIIVGFSVAIAGCLVAAVIIKRRRRLADAL